MDFQIEEKVEVVDIPFPSEILKGDWRGTVYAICTTYASKERHEEIVKEKVESIKSEFDKKTIGLFPFGLSSKKWSLLMKELTAI